MLDDGAGVVRRIARAAPMLSGLSALIFVALAAASRPVWAGTDVVFPRPKALEPNVQYWVKVFTQHSYRDFTIHDRDEITRAYQVLHLPGSGEPSQSDVQWTNAYLKTKYANLLDRLASGMAPSDYQERRVAEMFRGQPLSAYAIAAQNLRVQQGLRERFREGLLRSRYYRPTMERVFRQAGLPVELVTLAEVESGFYPRARSRAGAVGIWQFTRPTGRQYLTINRYRDERLNPLRSTEAAAELLRHNYEVLGNWPLAITAYNYGTAGMARAAQAFDHSYAEVFKNFDGPRFGFAAKNYYSEFLAALEVHRHETEYFPGIQYESVPPPIESSPILQARRAAHRSHQRIVRTRWPIHHRHHRLRRIAER